MENENSVSTESVIPESVVLEGGKPLIPRKVKKLGKKKAAVVAKAPAGRVLKKGEVMLKQILDELGLPLDGKLARRKLRAAKFDWHSHNERWIFDAKRAKKVREILGGSEE